MHRKHAGHCKQPTNSVASEQNEHYGFETRPKGPKLEARRAEPDPRVLGKRAYQLSPLPTSKGICRTRSAVSFPSGVWGKAPAAKNFGACWVLQVSCPAVGAVLLCKTVCVGPQYSLRVQFNAFTVHALHNSLTKIHPV